MGTPARLVSRARRALATRPATHLHAPTPWTRWLWPLAWMALLWALSSIPFGPAAEPEGLGGTFAWVPPTLQNLLHLPAYGILAWLWFTALRPRLSLALTLTVGVVVSAGYGILDEWHQAAVPGRYPSATDAAVNGVAAAIAAVVFALRPTRVRP